MKLYYSLLLLGILLLHNSVKAQDLDKTYRVQMNTYVKEVDTNMVQSKSLKQLTTKYLARVITVHNDSVYVLCYLKKRFTLTEFGLTETKENRLVLATSFYSLIHDRYANLQKKYISDPNLLSAFKLKVLEINKESIEEYAKGRVNYTLEIKVDDSFSEANLIRIAVVHKNDFNRVFSTSKSVSFLSAPLFVPFKIRYEETLHLIDAQPGIGVMFGLSFQIKNSKNRFVIGTGLVASRTKIDPQTITSTGPNPISTYHDPKFYNSYTIPFIVGLEYKRLNMGVIYGYDQFVVTTPIPVPFQSRVWTGFSFGYRVF